MSEATNTAESRRTAEGAREATWQGASFLQDAFLGRLRPELLAGADADAKHGLAASEFDAFYARMQRFLHNEVDPVSIDAQGEYPPNVIAGLKKLGAFGMKIAPQYGGLGLSNSQYVRVMQLLGSYDGNVTALLSAHQAIGVPHPVQMFGSDHLKNAYLPRCAKGAISAFALTEPAVGSDPARLETTADATPDGKEFVLNGLKLWCTNGTLAEVIVVLARDTASGRINCFVVEMNWLGVTVERRCHFMGLRALGNALISFKDVRIPRGNLIGDEGDGLKVALATLNTGRLTLPAATAGAAKLALETCRKWCSARVQWGQAIGKHEVIAHKLADMAATTYAMESMAEVVAGLADRPDRDLRLEAAAAKEWNTVRGWELTDSALQIRGGRGYETEQSLAARGEPAVGIERMLRDSRVNRIFEGSSEIMHLFIAREAVDKHLRVAGDLVDSKASAKRKLAALGRSLAFYSVWYPGLWLAGLLTFFRFWQYGSLGKHLRYADRVSRRLARSLFHGMLRYGARLEKKQAFLFRGVDAGIELLAMVATIVRAHRRSELDPQSLELAEHVAELARAQIEARLHGMWHNDDDTRYQLGRQVLDGRHAWLERGIVHLPVTAEDLVPMTIADFNALSKAPAAPLRARAGAR